MASARAQVETGVRARMDTVEVGDERLRSNRHGGGGWRVFELEWTWWRWSGWGSNGHDGGGRQAFGLNLRRWRWETSVCARVDMVEVDGERVGSNGHGGDGSVQAPMDTTEVGDERPGLI